MQSLSGAPSTLAIPKRTSSISFTPQPRMIFPITPPLFHAATAPTRFTSVRCWVSRPRKPGPDLGHWSLNEEASTNPGVDFQHWFVAMEKPGGKGATQAQMIDCFVRTLAQVVGSEEEAKKRIYKLYCDYEEKKSVLGFSCKVDWDTSFKLQELPGVMYVYEEKNPDPEFKGFPRLPRPPVVKVTEEKVHHGEGSTKVV